MTIEVQKGWREGTKITFTGEGDEQVGMNTGDVVFLLKEKPHPLFKRNKNDLIFTAKISLVEALTGTTVQVPTLDGRKISVPITEIVRCAPPPPSLRFSQPLRSSTIKSLLEPQKHVSLPTCAQTNDAPTTHQ